MAFDHLAVSIKFHGHLVFILCLQAAALLMVVSSSYNISKPGCKDKCGNISIPYPFGIGDQNCFLNKNFNITCNKTFNPPKAFIGGGGDRELLDIDLHQGQLRAKISITSVCYDKNGNRTTRHISNYDTELSLGGYEKYRPRVVNEVDKDEVMIVAKIAKRCLKLNGKKRPLMKEVAASLERLRKFQEQPLVQPYKLEVEDFLVGETSSRCATTSTIFEADESNSSFGLST